MHGDHNLVACVLFNYLPDEVLLHTFSFFDSAEDLLRAAQVSRRWRAMTMEEKFWMRISLNKWKNCRVEIYEGWRHFYLERSKVCKSSCNRIVVNSKEGNVYTIRPDGTDGRMITSDASGHKRYKQPTWSPQADRIAFSSASPIEGSAIYTCDQYGSKATAAKTVDPAFYIYWAPDDTRLLFMCNVWNERRTFGVFLVDVGRGGEDANLIETGFPFFFSWSNYPNDTRIMAHISRERLEIMNIEQRVSTRLHTFDLPTADTNGQVSRFSTPFWLASTHQAIYAVSGGGRSESYIISIDMLGDKRETIIAKCHSKSPLRFITSPNERFVAYAPTEGGLYASVLGEEDYLHKHISSEVMTVFYWSPNSRYLLWCYLDITVRSFYWAVYDTARNATYRLSSWVPSQDLMNNYFPFFSQYSRSMTVFSPDSNSFVYADHKGTVYVHGIHEGSAPVAVGEGTFAAWSPL